MNKKILNLIIHFYSILLFYPLKSSNYHLSIMFFRLVYQKLEWSLVQFNIYETYKYIRICNFLVNLDGLTNKIVSKQKYS